MVEVWGGHGVEADGAVVFGHRCCVRLFEDCVVGLAGSMVDGSAASMGLIIIIVSRGEWRNASWR